MRALESVARGDAVFGPAVASRILSYLTRPLAARDPILFPELSDREREVLCLVARGLTNDEIATDLHLAEATVRTHVGRVYAKAGVRDRAQAVVFAYESGLVRAGQSTR